MNEDNKLITERRSKLATLRESGNPFVNDFQPQDLAKDISASYGSVSKEELDEKTLEVSIAGRIMLKRVMGKASFAHIQDSSAQIQLFVYP